MIFYGTTPAIELTRPTPHGPGADSARTSAGQTPHQRGTPWRGLTSYARVLQQVRARQRQRRRLLTGCRPSDARSPQVPLYPRPRWLTHTRRCRGGALPPQPHLGAGRLARRHDFLCAFGLSDHAPAAQRSSQDRPHRPQELLDPPHSPPFPRRGNRCGGDLRVVHHLQPRDAHQDAPRYPAVAAVL